jgi:hypothetical protein
MGSPKAVLLADLLKESNAAARLIDITEAPDGHWFSLRVEIAGAVAKDLVLPKSLVLGARTDPKALRTLRNIMRVEVTMQRSRDAIEPVPRDSCRNRARFDLPALLEVDPAR